MGRGRTVKGQVSGATTLTSPAHRPLKNPAVVSDICAAATPLFSLT